MNTFGTIFRISIFGESHGRWVGITIDGCPAGIPLTEADLQPDLDRRKAGAAGTTPRTEADIPTFATGVYNGHTTGAPLTIIFENANTRSADYDAVKSTPRPGHADFVLQKKFNGFNDYRGGGHSSGRLTVALVAAGVVAKKVLGSDISVKALLTEAGGSTDIEAAIAKAVAQQDSIGGIVACTVKGLPVGIGEPFFNSLESVISHAIFSIPAIKGIEFGSGFAAAGMTGSTHNDAIVDANGTTATNNAGGVNGGISNGNDLTFRIAVKPASSTPQPQRTWNNATASVEEFALKGRHDLCIALRVPVVAEAVTAIALADMYLQRRS
ncbi:chorismate synthase [Nemorincola caseinilytica]|uniref:Chorismate synthase n=1 Tax=Nemorincola caseinilytica TaxID=2054315 RepID=A0ABP8NC10_9BACT